MHETKLEAMKKYAEEKGLDLSNLANWNTVERAVERKHPELAYEPLGSQGVMGPGLVVNDKETDKVTRWLEKNPNSGRDLLAKLENEVVKLRMSAINAELIGVENPYHPLVYTKAEERAAVKHRLLFSGDPENWTSALEFSRSLLASETVNRISDAVFSKGVRLSKLSYLDQLSDLAGITVNELKSQFPNRTVEEILNFLKEGSGNTFHSFESAKNFQGVKR